MDIMELGALGELVGAVAVVATLVYLAVGIRRNTDSVNTARYETITLGFNDINGILAGDEELAHQFNLALTHPEGLTPEQRARSGIILRMYHNQYNKLFHLFGAGIIPEQEWSDFAAQWAQILATPGGAAYLLGNTDNPELSEAVEPYLGHSTYSFDIPTRS